MKRIALFLAVSLVFATVSFGQQSAADAPASKEDIQKYLDVMHVQDMMKTMMASMTKQMHQMVHQQIQKQLSLTPDFEARMDKMMDDLVTNFPIDDLIASMIPVYERHLTKGDVEALITFYSSPTGQKILKEMPAMTAEAMQASSGLMQKVMTQTMDKVQTEILQASKVNDGNLNKQPPATQN
jgi:uncharacterized protein